MLNLHSYDHMIHVPALRNQFFLKRLTKARTSINNRGRLSVSYVFVDSSEDFEHVEIPTGETTGQATPTATPDEDGASEEREEVELPPGWEERVVRCSIELTCRSPCRYCLVYIIHHNGLSAGHVHVTSSLYTGSQWPQDIHQPPHQSCVCPSSRATGNSWLQ